MKERMNSIEDAIGRLLKSMGKKEDPEEVEEEMDQEDLDQTEEMDQEPTDQEATEEEVQEDAEEGEEAQEAEEEEEDLEESEDTEDLEETETMDLDEVVEAVSNRIMEDVKGYIDELLKKPQEDIEGLGKDLDELTGAVEKSLTIMEELAKEPTDQDVYKSLNDKLNRMEALVKSRRSVSSITETGLQERFEKSLTIDSLSKSQKAAILASQIEAGNKTISATDVTAAEIGGRLSQAAIEAIEKAI